MATLDQLLQQTQPINALDNLIQQTEPVSLGSDPQRQTPFKQNDSLDNLLAETEDFAAPSIADPGEPNVSQDQRIGFGESVAEEFTRPAKGAQLLPFVGGVVGTAENLLFLDASNRLKEGFDYTQPTQKGQITQGAAGFTPDIFSTKEKDQKLIGDLLIKTERAQEQGFTFGGKVAKGLIQLPSWMVEFALTGGLASIGSKAAQKAGVKLLGRYAKTKAGQTALKAAGWTGGAITRTTLGLTARVTEKATERQVGVEILGADQEGWATSFAKAWGDVVIESASETAGQAITGVPIKLLNKTKLGSRFLNGLREGWMKLTGGTVGEFAKKMATKGGYSNLLGEYGEERLGTILRAITQVDDFGAKALHEKENGEGSWDNLSLIEKTTQSMKAGLTEDAKNIGVELTVLAAIPTGQVILGQAGRLIPGEIEQPRDFIEEATADLPVREAIAEAEPAVVEPTEEISPVVPTEPKIEAPEPSAKPEIEAKPPVSKEVTAEKGQEGKVELFRGKLTKGQEGKFFSTDKEFAREFTQSGQDKEIETITINQSDIFKKEILPSANNEAEIDTAIKEAKDAGFKAVLVDEGKGQPNSVFLIDKKLTDVPSVQTVPESAKEPAPAQPPKATETKAVEEPIEAAEKINVREAKAGLEAIQKKFETIKPIEPTKIVSPGEAGPGKVTFKATKDLVATRLIKDPKLRKQAQSFENKIAKLKTRIAQAKSDNKVRLANRLSKQRSIAERKLSALREKTEFKAAKVKESIVIAKELRQEIRELASQALTPAQKDVIITSLAKVGPERNIVTNQKDLGKVIVQVGNFLKENEKKQAIGQLKKRIKKVKEKLKKPPKKGGFNQKQADQLKTLIDSFDVKDISQASQDKIIRGAEKLRKFLSELREKTESEFGAEFVELKISKERLELLQADTETQKANLLTTEGLNEISREIDRLIHLSDTINTLKIGRQRRELTQIRDDAVKHIEVNVVDKSKNQEIVKQEKEEGLPRKALDITVGTNNYATFQLANTISGGQRSIITEILEDDYQGGIHETNKIKKEIVEEVQKRLKQQGITEKDLRAMSEVFDPRFTLTKKIFKKTPKVVIELNGTPFQFSQANLIDIFLSAKQPKGLKHLTDKGLVFGKTKVDSGPLSVEDLDNIASQMTEKSRTIAAILTGVGDTLQKDAINKTSQELDGFDKAQVENYWHLETFTEKKIKGQFGVSLLENQGFLQKRTAGTRRLIVRDAFVKFFSQVNGVAEYAGMAKPLRNAKFLLNNEDFIKASKDKGYEKERTNIAKIIQLAESQSPVGIDPIGSFLQKSLRGVIRAVIPLNPRVVMSQFTSSIGYGTEIDKKFFRLATRPRISPKRIKEATDISPTLWERIRMGHSSVELAELGASDSVLKMFSGKSKNINKANVGVKISDAAAMINAIDIAKAEIRAKTLKSGSADYWNTRDRKLKPQTDEWKEAIRKRAEFLWLRTQPSWDAWNRSLNTSAKGTPKMFLMFRSYFEKTLSMAHDANVRYSNEIAKGGSRIKAGSEWSKRIGVIYTSMAVNALLRLMISALIVGELPDIKQALAEMIAAPASMIAVFGRHLQTVSINLLSSAFQSKAKKKFSGDGISSLPISMMNNLLRTAETYTKAAGSFLEGDTEKAEKKLKTALKQTWTNVGLYLGIPTFLINKALKRFVSEDSDSAF